MAHEIQTISSRGFCFSKLSFLFCLLAFIAPFVIPRMFFDYSVVTKEAVLQIGIMSICSMLLFVMIRNGSRLKVPAAIPFILIFLLYAFASLFLAVNPYEGFVLILHWSMCLIAIFIVANAVNKDHLFLTLFASGVVVSIIGLLQHYAGFDYFQQVAAPASTFGNKNFAAHYAVVCLPLGFILPGRKKILSIIGALIIVAYVYACRTDAALLALGVLSLFGFGMYFYNINCLKIAMIVLVAVSAITLSNINWRSDVRVEVWNNARLMLADNPSGVGVGNFKIRYPEYNNEGLRPNSTTINIESVHNEYIELLTEVGFTGMTLFILAACGVLGKIDKSKSCGVAALIAICIVSFFSFPMRLPMIPFAGACILGALSE